MDYYEVSRHGASKPPFKCQVRGCLQDAPWRVVYYTSESTVSGWLDIKRYCDEHVPQDAKAIWALRSIG